MTPGNREISYDQYRGQAQDGDILLWKPRDLIGRAIAWETSGPYCHASIVLLVRGRVMQAYYYDAGPGITALSREVRQNSGKISVFRPIFPTINDGSRAEVADEIIAGIGGDYAMRNIELIWLESNALGRFIRGIPFVNGWADRKVEEQSRSRSSSVCHQFVRRCWKSAEVELIPGVPMSGGSPNLLSRSSTLLSMGELVWPEGRE